MNFKHQIYQELMRPKSSSFVRQPPQNTQQQAQDGIPYKDRFPINFYQRENNENAVGCSSQKNISVNQNAYLQFPSAKTISYSNNNNFEQKVLEQQQQQTSYDNSNMKNSQQISSPQNSQKQYNIASFTSLSTQSSGNHNNNNNNINNSNSNCVSNLPPQNQKQQYHQSLPTTQLKQQFQKQQFQFEMIPNRDQRTYSSSSTYQSINSFQTYKPYNVLESNGFKLNQQKDNTPLSGNQTLSAKKAELNSHHYNTMGNFYSQNQNNMASQSSIKETTTTGSPSLVANFNNISSLHNSPVLQPSANYLNIGIHQQSSQKSEEDYHKTQNSNVIQKEACFTPQSNFSSTLNSPVLQPSSSYLNFGNRYQQQQQQQQQQPQQQQQKQLEDYHNFTELRQSQVRFASADPFFKTSEKYLGQQQQSMFSNNIQNSTDQNYQLRSGEKQQALYYPNYPNSAEQQKYSSYSNNNPPTCNNVERTNNFQYLPPAASQILAGKYINNNINTRESQYSISAKSTANDNTRRISEHGNFEHDLQAGYNNSINTVVTQSEQETISKVAELRYMVEARQRELELLQLASKNYRQSSIESYKEIKQKIKTEKKSKKDLISSPKLNTFLFNLKNNQKITETDRKKQYSMQSS